MLRPSPNHGTQRLPNDGGDDDDDDVVSSKMGNMKDNKSTSSRLDST